MGLVVLDRRRAGHDIPVDIPARGERGEEAMVQSGNGRFQARFNNAVKLDALPTSQANGLVGIFFGEIVNSKILFGGEQSTGNPATNHEHIEFASRNPFLSVFPGITVFLLVRTVELQKLLPGLVEVILIPRQELGNSAPEATAGKFDGLDRGRGGNLGRFLDLVAHRMPFTILPNAPTKANLRLSYLVRDHSVPKNPSYQPLGRNEPLDPTRFSTLES